MENIDNKDAEIVAQVKAEDQNPMMAAIVAIQLMVNDNASFGAEDQEVFDGLVANAKSLALSFVPQPPVAFMSAATANTLDNETQPAGISVIV